MMHTSLQMFLFSFGMVLCLAQTSRAAEPAPSPLGIEKFVKQQCVSCHQGESAEGGLDLTVLKTDLTQPEAFRRWVRIYDRVHSGEMPPKEADPIKGSERNSFLATSHSWLTAHQRKLWNTEGRVQGRRLTNVQLERTLHSLLGVDIPLASLMPDEQTSARYTTIAAGQAMSHFQIEQHLKVVDAALDNAFERALQPQKLTTKEFDAKGLSRTNPRSRTREPELIDGFAVTWSSRLIFYGRVPATTSRKDGWYRFTLRAKSLKSPKDYGVWCTIRTGKCVSSAPLLNWVTAIEVTPEVREWTFETWLPKGDMLEIRPGDDTLKMGRFEGGQVGTGEGGPQDLPGIAMESLVMEEIHHGPADLEIRQLLFDDLQVDGSGRSWRDTKLLSKQPATDARRLLVKFAERAFRRPVEASEIAPYLDLVEDQLQNNQPLLAALRTGYRAILSSPRFLYFNEAVGELDPYAIASRLSYFLWNAPPDQELLELAKSGVLKNPEVIRSQVRRMLGDERGSRFVSDFAAQWLELNQIDFTTPDRRMFPEFDVIVQQSMLAETETYLREMLDQNLSVERIVASNDTYLNERLARYYRIAGIRGDAMQKVSLKPEDKRGGLITQGAILKVTANGTTTSPVIRGVWISERLLGVEIPPPPTSVPAIEPDVRGAKSIREMLEKHQSDPACSSCHRNIDPPGFALENYDPTGRWRESYSRLGEKRSTQGIPIDPSHQFPSGESFKDVRDFQKILAGKPEKLAENVAEQLLAYGTGAPVTYSDREDIERMVDQTKPQQYGFRSIVEEVAASHIFRIK